MYELIIQTDFAAAHSLRGYAGDCERLHGHNWKLDVVVSSPKLDKQGMVCDFREVKKLLARVVDRLDHRHLNELDFFRKLNPTTENVARVISEELDKLLPSGVRVTRVTAWESDHCGATYFSRERTS